MGGVASKESVVIREISSALSGLEGAGDVLWWSRLNSGKVKTEWGSYIQLCKPGTHDFIAVIRGKIGGLIVIFIEAKADGITAKYRPTQAEFKRQYSKHHDMLFWLVQSGSEVKKLIIEHGYDRLSEIEFNA